MFCIIWYVLYDLISYRVQKANFQSAFRHISLFFFEGYSSVYEDLVITAVLVYDKFERIERTYGTLAIYTLKE